MFNWKFLDKTRKNSDKFMQQGFDPFGKLKWLRARDLKAWNNGWIFKECIGPPHMFILCLLTQCCRTGACGLGEESQKVKQLLLLCPSSHIGSDLKRSARVGGFPWNAVSSIVSSNVCLSSNWGCKTMEQKRISICTHDPCKQNPSIKGGKKSLHTRYHSGPNIMWINLIHALFSPSKSRSNRMNWP